MATATTKKRTLSPEGRKEIAEAQKRRWGSTDHQSAENLVEKEKLVEKKESAESAIHWVANRVEQLESSLEDYKNTVNDLVGALRREYTYHALRAEELDRILSGRPESV